MGMISSKGIEDTTIPAAWVEMCFFSPSNFMDIWYSFFRSGLLCIALTTLLFCKFSFKVSLESIIFKKLSKTGIEISKAFPTLRKTSLLFKVPNVIMPATLSLPYFCFTYSTTSPLRLSSKSISISGMVTLWGFKNLSNKRL